MKSLGVWRKQEDRTRYIDSQNDKSFGSNIAEKNGEEYWIHVAEETNSIEKMLIRNDI